MCIPFFWSLLLVVKVVVPAVVLKVLVPVLVNLRCCCCVNLVRGHLTGSKRPGPGHNKYNHHEEI